MIIDLYIVAVLLLALKLEVNRRYFFRNSVHAGIDPALIGFEVFLAFHIRRGLAKERGKDRTKGSSLFAAKNV